jgi:hypothetical protein
MGRIFISAGHFNRDSDATSILGMKEADEMMKTRDALIVEIQSRGLVKDQDFFSVPDDIDLGQTIRWINSRSQSGDVAVEIHGDSAGPTAQSSTAFFYVAGNSQRQADAKNLVDALVTAVPGLRNRGTKPDTDTRFGRLGFCRDVDIPSILIELCFLTNRSDINLLTSNRNQFAQGLANGLLAWSGITLIVPPPPDIDIQINGTLYDDKRILVNGNSFIPTTEASDLIPINQAGNQPSVPPEDENGGDPPPPPPDGTPLPNIWIYEGKAYDLTEFISKHPGGQFFIGRTKNRDITTIVNIFHRNPERVQKVLGKYALDQDARPEHIHPKYNAPAFLFKEGFNGWQHTPKFNFDNKNQLLYQIKARVNKPEMMKQIAQIDYLFNAISFILVIAYLLIQGLRLTSTVYMPLYLFVPLMVMLRISLAGVGHYLIHRPQVGWNKIFANVFDINYVPLTMVVTDGHSLMHHPFTETEVDIKQNVFTFMLELPRLYRVPIHTIHKIGHVITGMWARTIELAILTMKAGVKEIYGSWQLGLPHFVGTFALRFILLFELILFWVQGDLVAWLLQFAITMWISTFMIVASHDFEDTSTDIKSRSDEDWAKEDWAVLQIQNSYDLTIFGNKYLDCFLSAGLSPHRVHHVLPQQKSGFANIISEEIVREEAAKFNVPWLSSKNFFLDRLPVLIKYYLGAPSRMAHENNWGLLKEHFHPKSLRTTIEYLVKGFTGIGSI